MKTDLERENARLLEENMLLHVALRDAQSVLGQMFSYSATLCIDRIATIMEAINARQRQNDDRPTQSAPDSTTS